MPRTKQKLVIIGASGQGKVAGEVAQMCGSYASIVYLDNDTTIKSCLAYPVVGQTNEWKSFDDDVVFFVAIGNNAVRQKVSEEIGIGRLVTLIHPDASISSHATLGKGCIVMAQAVVGVEAVISDGCIINTGATVDHESILSSFVHLSPRVSLGGQTSIGLRSWLGIGAVVSNNIDIASDVLVGAGGVVVRHIGQSGTYVGVPVKLLQEKKSTGVQHA